MKRDNPRLRRHRARRRGWHGHRRRSSSRAATSRTARSRVPTSRTARVQTEDIKKGTITKRSAGVTAPAEDRSARTGGAGRTGRTGRTGGAGRGRQGATGRHGRSRPDALLGTGGHEPQHDRVSGRVPALWPVHPGGSARPGSSAEFGEGSLNLVVSGPPTVPCATSEKAAYGNEVDFAGDLLRRPGRCRIPRLHDTGENVSAGGVTPNCRRSRSRSTRTWPRPAAGNFSTLDIHARLDPAR